MPGFYVACGVLVLMAVACLFVPEGCDEGQATKKARPLL